jgi:hypothetical protein
MAVIVALFALLAADAWPVVQLDTLAGTKSSLPAGKVCIVVTGFSKDSGPASKAWVERFTRDGGLAFLAPVLEGAPRLVRGLIRSGMRRDIPVSLHEKTLLIYSDEAGWKRRVNFARGTEKEPYVVLLDAQGRPQWTHHGVFDERVYAELRRKAAGL